MHPPPRHGAIPSTAGKSSQVQSLQRVLHLPCAPLDFHYSNESRCRQGAAPGPGPGFGRISLFCKKIVSDFLPRLAILGDCDGKAPCVVRPAGQPLHHSRRRGVNVPEAALRILMKGPNRNRVDLPGPATFAGDRTDSAKSVTTGMGEEPSFTYVLSCVPKHQTSARGGEGRCRYLSG